MSPTFSRQPHYSSINLFSPSSQNFSASFSPFLKLANSFFTACTLAGEWQCPALITGKQPHCACLVYECYVHEQRIEHWPLSDWEIGPSPACM